jgi:hypothetical protein
MKINKIKIGIEFLVLLVLLSGLTSAFGVSYIWGNPLKMYPGESKDIYINLQNRAGDIGDVSARVEIVEGQEIATLTDNLETYFIPYNSKTQVNFTVKIPKNAEYNETYSIKLSVTTVSDKESGGMGFAMGSGKIIDVLIVPKSGEAEIAEESPPVWGILVFVGLAIIIIAIILILLVRKKLRK